MIGCYYYDFERNRCNCYLNEGLDELLSENAEMVLKLNAEHIAFQNEKAENNRLRELVADTADWMKSAMLDGYIRGHEYLPLIERVEELGIEVSE